MNECVWETSDSDRDPELCQDRHNPNTQFDTMKLWPIYLMLGNLSKYVCAKMDSRACNHVVYIPSVRHSKTPEKSTLTLVQLPDHFHNFAATFHKKWSMQQKDILTHCRCELIHAVWNLLLDDAFIYAFKYGIVIECADGVEHCCRVLLGLVEVCSCKLLV